MNLTFINRLKLCFEILTIRSGYKYPANEKQLSTFINGYNAGFKDNSLNYENIKLLNTNENLYREICEIYNYMDRNFKQVSDSLKIAMSLRGFK